MIESYIVLAGRIHKELDDLARLTRCASWSRHGYGTK